ncbi:MAG: hypothetical protein NXI18_09855 [Alphaproteobacteria bacterium]|nr:hypothetical protein [Alphaproteobacteria bacterium]
MALTNTPAWPQSPRHSVVGVSAPNTATDGSGTIATVISAGSDGTRITGLHVGASATVTATAVRFFISMNGGGSWTYLPRLDVAIPAHSFSDTTSNAGRVMVIDQNDPAQTFDLPGNAVLGVTITLSVTGGKMIVEAMGADY